MSRFGSGSADSFVPEKILDVILPTVLRQPLHPNLVVHVEQLLVAEALLGIEEAEPVQKLCSNVSLHFLAVSGARDSHRWLQANRT